MLDDLNDDNFTIYAMKCYSSPNCIMSEFESDIKRTKYLKRLFRRYKITKSLKERLILNHLIFQFYHLKFLFSLLLISYYSQVVYADHADVLFEFTALALHLA